MSSPWQLCVIRPDKLGGRLSFKRKEVERNRYGWPKSLIEALNASKGLTPVKGVLTEESTAVWRSSELSDTSFKPCR